ncbi:MAG TPA: phage holin family protein [Gammaproteobacteria bacterium]|nr:phage holin family protein [Gammaproteobacteria bacterium]
MEIFNLIKQLSKNSLSLASNSLRLIHLEITLAKKSLPVLAGLLFLLICFITSLWVFLFTLLVVHLNNHGISIYHALFGVLGIHLLLVIIVVLFILKYIGHLKLSATRRHLKSVLFKQPD